VPRRERPLYEEVLDWVTPHLRAAGLPQSLCKRLALLVCGLVAREKATLGKMSAAVETLAISAAKCQ
jgi:hypothetical protein